MIYEDYVNLEIAKLLRDKGFDEPTTVFLNDDGDFLGFSFHQALPNSILIKTFYSCPTLQMVRRWLIEYHNLFIVIDFERRNCYEYKIFTDNCGGRKELLYYEYEDSYENACLVAIKYCLENLI